MSKKFFYTLLFLFLLPFILQLTGCASAPKPSKDTSNYLTELAERNGVQWQLDIITQVITLQRGEFTARALVGSDVVIVQGENIQLSAPIERGRKGIVVPPDFSARVLSRLTKSVIVLPPKKHKIILDAGHGGHDPGALGRSGLMEKDVVWDITKRLKGLLEGRGLTVALTRSGDNFISLEERTEIAAREKADMFVSIHANASKSKHVEGIEVYTLRPLTWEEKKDEQRLRNYRVFFNKLTMQKSNKNLEMIVAEMMERNKKVESFELRQGSRIGHPARLTQTTGG